MVDACAVMLASNFCPDWSVDVPELTLYEHTADVPDDGWIVSIVDDTDDPDNLGAHGEAKDGRVFAYIDVNRILGTGGGGVLSSNFSAGYCVAGVLCHELMEMLVDPFINIWWEGDITVKGAHYTTVSAEVCDPVEDTPLIVTVNGTDVQLTDYILPSWSNPTGEYPYDAAGKCKRPFEVLDGGYVIVRDKDGNRKSVFGDALPQWRADGKGSPLSRSGRRLSR